MGVILSTAYLPPVDYIKVIKYADRVYLEKFENYQKQSYRNRCYILSSNGKLPLYVPVERGNGSRIDKIGIDNSTKWQHQHWQSIVSAYNSSPFFDFYRDDFFSFYRDNYDNLWDFNIKMLFLILELFEIETRPEFTEGYVKTPPLLDLRSAIHPKRNAEVLQDIKKGQYHQVFAHKFGFVPGLSAIDLLFNEGPQAALFI